MFLLFMKSMDGILTYSTVKKLVVSLDPRFGTKKFLPMEYSFTPLLNRDFCRLFNQIDL